MERPLDTSVYVHVPYCARRCPYCDFATRAIDPTDVPSDAYAEAVVRELAVRAPRLEGRRLASVFFGGGTPSLLAPRAVARIVSAARAAFSDEVEALEVTAECNPSSLDEAKALGFAEAGINRISLGVQSLDDGHLRFLGRLHDAQGALRALAHARRAVPRVSGDLMFGMPGQTVGSLGAEIDRLLDAGVEHVSAYSLTVEPGTPFHELQQKRRLPLAPEEESAAMFVEAEAAFAARGLRRYEVSNYARPGAEARHNLHYWRGGAYLGLGAAAVGCLDDGPGRARRWRNLPDGDAYLAADPRACEESEEHLDGATIVREALMLGLRTDEGVDVARTEARAGRPLRLGRERALDRALGRGAVVLEAGRLRAPRASWLHLDGLVAELF